MPIALVTIWTDGSITQIRAPMLITVAGARFSTPSDVAVICLIRKTAKVMPISRAGAF